MNYASIISFDLANGPGIRVSLFVSGCKFHCPGCFNEKVQDFNFGSKFTDKQVNIILDRLKHPDFQGLSLLGGDPLWQDEEGTNKLISLCKTVHSMGKDVWLWTGFNWDDVFRTGTDYQKELLSNCDVVIDGRFEIDKKNLSLYWKGSTNQRVIDVKKTLESKEVVTLQFS